MANRREPALPKRPGGEKSLRKRILEAGSDLLQDTSPLKDFDVYVVGFHCAKHDPHMQMEAHHYCKQVGEDFLQCTIFDGNTRDANLIGIEYIISEELFEGLPQEEKSYWHPHNFEVLSGTLVAPGLPDVAEKALMRVIMNSYGKTWHTWHTGRHDGKGEPGHPLPYGDPHLMWSFNRDGELDNSLLVNRDTTMGIDTGKKRLDRQDLAQYAKPQEGVDTLKDAYPHSSEPPSGVSDKRHHQSGGESDS